ncbi:ABC transporter substrate-binding protein (plasmid) [Rhizobium leguminosarum]|uniref:ABC transporter substrate-binding protein n=1 Tax=Rhizobium leguminosarum TaxID=384 RepID=A0A444IG17_RHILE|nr:ABC transporter substrate-binding protein [Rhizobium leguminosarum]MDH6660512.1 branched-chain amino acid transport system substrate-binding protein [Rhizobium sophorae]ASS58304.1 ABC transporter substrate-binding protein [Rhizobium leguminosarum bv. viciae]AVC47379.1 periplasmic binding family protein [Rhizobium leguminosarum bv. viciae]MBB4329693.1 branched-chain amino acid transport system substrate-binding protein [Rhizobium leguminosarum]MBB4345906.1 branched-chain amino acid transport
MNGIFRSGKFNAASLSRRSFIASTVAGGAALALSRRTAFAQSGDTLKVGFISPRTGPLGGFGETDGYVLELARKALANGLQAGGKTWKVDILDQDTQSDPSRAGQLAKDLINNQAIDLMLAVSTPETINPVADACEAAGIPCLSTVMPWEAWYFGRGAKPGAPSPFKWTYHFGFGVEEFHKAYVSQWNLIETNKKVGVMYPNDADGNAIRTHLAPALAKAGFTIVDPGAYETGTTDFTAQIALFRQEGVEIFNSFPIPPDFAAFWRQAAQQGLTQQIKICQIAKTGLFPSDIEALGDLGLNIGSAAYWHKAFPYKSTLTGVSGTELADGYETASGKQWTQQLGASLALLDAGFDALKASTDVKSKEAVAEAISTLKTTTIAGKVDFTSGPVANVSPGPIIGTQWVKAAEGSKFALDYVVTENATDPNVPVGAKLTAYNG